SPEPRIAPGSTTGADRCIGRPRTDAEPADRTTHASGRTHAGRRRRTRLAADRARFELAFVVGATRAQSQFARVAACRVIEFERIGKQWVVVALERRFGARLAFGQSADSDRNVSIASLGLSVARRRRGPRSSESSPR